MPRRSRDYRSSEHRANSQCTRRYLLEAPGAILSRRTGKRTRVLQRVLRTRSRCRPNVCARNLDQAAASVSSSVSLHVQGSSSSFQHHGMTQTAASEHNPILARSTHGFRHVGS